jgi:hypothetical protein
MLQIQVHVRLPKPIQGITYTRELLDALAERWLKNEPLPKRVTVTALEWRWGDGKYKIERNPQRLKRVREDFRFITEAGPFRFTGFQTLG